MEDGEQWSEEKATTWDLLAIYYVSDEGFAGESMFLAQEELKKRGFTFKRHKDGACYARFPKSF